VVPALSGVKMTEATRLLADRKIAIGGLLQIPSNLPAGQVVRTAPESGATIAPGDSVTLYVSAGGQKGGATKVIVPFFTGIDMMQAQGVAQELGLTLEVQGTGRISEQSPAPGTEVARGSVVKVTLK
jgi:serine/threonine-protein kinase